MKQTKHIDEQELKNLQDKYVDWVSDEFPKGVWGRGQAAVLVGLMLADFSKTLATATQKARIDELTKLRYAQDNHSTIGERAAFFMLKDLDDRLNQLKQTNSERV